MEIRYFHAFYPYSRWSKQTTPVYEHISLQHSWFIAPFHYQQPRDGLIQGNDESWYFNESVERIGKALNGIRTVFSTGERNSQTRRILSLSRVLVAIVYYLLSFAFPSLVNAIPLDPNSYSVDESRVECCPNTVRIIIESTKCSVNK